MTRYSFIRVTRSFVFPSLFNHFLGCSPTALNAQNQKMLGNKETRIRTRYTHTDKREDSEKDRCWNHVRGVFKSRNSNMLNIFFITFSRVSLLFLFHFLIFFFLFSLFFLYMHMHIIHFILFFIFPAFPFYFAGSPVSPSRDFDNAFEPTQFFLSPPFSIKLCCSR